MPGIENPSTPPLEIPATSNFQTMDPVPSLTELQNHLEHLEQLINAEANAALKRALLLCYNAIRDILKLYFNITV